MQRETILCQFVYAPVGLCSLRLKSVYSCQLQKLCYFVLNFKKIYIYIVLKVYLCLILGPEGASMETFCFICSYSHCVVFLPERLIAMWLVDLKLFVVIAHMKNQVNVPQCFFFYTKNVYYIN